MLDARPSSRSLATASTAAELVAPATPFSSAVSLNELKAAIDHLMMSRPDPVYLMTGEGKILSESPTGALARSNGAAFDRVLVELAHSNPRRAEFFVRPELGVGFHISPCAARSSSKLFLITIAKLAPVGRGRLTLRQAELISFLQEGLSNAQIAKRMGIAPSTVKTMLERLYRFASVSNRQALVHWASGARVN